MQGKGKKHYLHMDKASKEESSMKEKSSMKEEVDQLKALLVSWDRGSAPLQMNQVAMISLVIQWIVSSSDIIKPVGFSPQ